MSKYKIDKVIAGRFAVWYMDINDPKQKNVLGVYKVLDLFSSSKNTSFIRRYKARPNQTQEVLDSQLVQKCINRVKALKK